MHGAVITLAGFCAATQAMACVSPTRPAEGYPLKVRADCSFDHAGGADKQLTWMGGPAYRLKNGLVAQVVAGFGYCAERETVGLAIADCESRRATYMRNVEVVDFSATDGLAGPELPMYLAEDQRADYDAVLSNDKVHQRDLASIWAEPGTGAHPDPFCGCALPSLPAN